ncbi:MAG TPA: hypothetical protein VJ866_14615 [Pyrinomonadaceae bacterium]|nr:hypothetical protein [Pyrinomonadaceae bacterium]
MLTRKGAGDIRRLGLATIQDYWGTSLSAGEPFYEGGVLSYFDGRMVTLSGFALRDSDPPTPSALGAAAEAWVVERKAEAVLLLGPSPVGKLLRPCSGLRLICEEHRPVTSSELLIDCAAPDSRRRSVRLCRRGRGFGLRLGARAGGIVTAEHFALVEKFYRLRPLSSFLADVSFVIPALLRSPRVRIVEAQKDGSLAGFLVMHRPFDDVAVGMCMFHDHATAGVSDLLYHGMLTEARRLGARYVNVGASPTRGQYDFKLKWGGLPLVPPYHCAVWARGHLGRRNYISWGPRLVGL